MGLYEVLGIAVPRTEYGAGKLRTFLERDLDCTLVLLIDEAQNLTKKQLFEVQLLTNQEASGRPLATIILAGQPSLRDLLMTPELAALHQRIAVRMRIKPLDKEHTQLYIEHHLRIAGARGNSIFSREAFDSIHRQSRGIPRLINQICDRSLIIGFVEEVDTIDEALVQEASLQLADEEESLSSTGRGRLPKSSSRIALLEQKVDAIAQMLVRGGVVDPDHVDNAQGRSWAQNLKRQTQDVADEMGDNMTTIEPSTRNPQEEDSNT
jgi:hypothetical protein